MKKYFFLSVLACGLFPAIAFGAMTTDASNYNVPPPASPNYSGLSVGGAAGVVYQDGVSMSVCSTGSIGSTSGVVFTKFGCSYSATSTAGTFRIIGLLDVVCTGLDYADCITANPDSVSAGDVADFTVTFVGASSTFATSSYDTNCLTQSVTSGTLVTCDDPLKTQTAFFIDLCEVAICSGFGFWFIKYKK